MFTFLNSRIFTVLCVSTGSRPNARTPSSGRRSKTPNGGDRFIPVRSSTNFELGHYKVVNTLACVKCLGCSGSGP